LFVPFVVNFRIRNCCFALEAEFCFACGAALSIAVILCYTAFMTLQQTVTIPADRRLHLDLSLPETFSPGAAQIVFTITRIADKGIAEEQDARRFRESLNAMCLNRSTFENPSPAPLEPLLGMAEASSFTVERLLQDRRAEEARDSWTTTPSTLVR
jgi:hypothetical protein